MSLENNWKLKNGAYKYICANSGSDINDGTLSAPKRTIFSGTTVKVLRAGYYRVKTDGVSIPNLITDGHVIIDGRDLIQGIVGQGRTKGSWKSLIRGATLVKNFQLIQIMFGNPIDSHGQVLFDGFHFSNISRIRGGFSTANTQSETHIGECYNFCLFTSCADVSHSGGDSHPSRQFSFRNTYINSIIRIYRDCRIKNCVFDADSQINTIKSFTTSSGWERATEGTFYQCVFESGFKIGDMDFQSIVLDGMNVTIGSFDDGELFSGSYTTLDGGLITFEDCFWTDDLGFNNKSGKDYTLKASPQSVLFNESNIIGCYGIVLGFNANHSAFDPANAGVSYTDVIRTTGSNPSFSLVASAQEGEVVSTNDPTACIDLGSIHTINEAINILGSFNYYNGDWVDAVDYKSGVSDQVRHTIDFQVYDENEPNGADNTSNWSNWISTEVFSPIQQDASGLGNGHIDADLGALENLSVRRLRVKFRMVEGALL